MKIMKPKVIFLDAVGTLFGVRGSVGENYGKIASQFGVNIAPEILDRAFFKCFKNSSPLAFLDVEISKISELEYNWWKSLAIVTFTEAQVLDKITDFDVFFEELYQYFATENPWFIYDDVIPTLEYWQKQGIKLAIISNFDTRIYQLLKLLKLDQFFSNITISSVTGYAKPNKEIFVKALEDNDSFPEETWHIGDSYQEDYQGALSLGINAFLLKRPEQSLKDMINFIDN
jgi:putative hydrolase of the HAD superfamily